MEWCLWLRFQITSLGRLFICRILALKMFSGGGGGGAHHIFWAGGRLLGDPLHFECTVCYIVSQDLCTCTSTCSLSN